MKPENLLLFAVKDVGRETSMCLEHLACHCVTHAVFLLRQISNVISMGVHDDIAIGLLEPHENVHHLELALDDQGGIVEQSHCWVGFFEDAIGIFWDMNRGYEVVLGIRRG